ncbi:hypothetical protein OOJ91_24470 [Micromonospora lupini]|uniref:hypothetical protein n=1 Tax=Micromonospora lupini TaxID=285679 RepID=UPI0022542499|nr:hypothetical protein [Micromonospora lupini]MCX5069003.1 hypothetical protein [Micromonospora lupini]
MRNTKNRLVATAVAASLTLAIGTIGAPAAVAGPATSVTGDAKSSAVAADNPGRATLKSATRSLQRYTDSELLELLLAAQGPVAEQHPELVRILGFDPAKPHTDDAALDAIVTAYLKHDRDFHEATAKPLQSGDPTRVNEGLRVFSVSFNEFIRAQGGNAVSGKSTFTTQAGWFYMGANVAIYANAVGVANAVAYANVGVATFALATVALVTWYLEDGSAAGSQFERDILVNAFTDALA